MKRIVGLVLTAAFPFLVPGAVDIPITRIVLYKHGIAYFERSGAVAQGEESRLEFKSGEMNDVLKSFTVRDAFGQQVTGVRYDSNESMDQRLAKFPFHLGYEQPVTALLDRMKGSELQIKTGDQSVKGTIVGARSIDSGTGDSKASIREQVTLLLESGDMGNFDLERASSFRLTDPHLQEQLKQYLATLSRGRADEKRILHIDFTGSGRRELRISYMTPAAIWKSSYRLALNGGASTLEGWAVVDNTTDQDWNDVKLTVVSGRPISFVSLLDVPRFGNRQVAELPEDRAEGPTVYGGALDGVPRAASGNGDGFGPGTGGGTGGGTYRVGDALSRAKAFVPGAGLAVSEQMGQASLSVGSSSVEGASGETLGELFEYNFAAPVTVKKNESAMLPFLQDKLEARKLLIYNNTGSEHPVNAVELVNGTEKTLDGGPVTVFDGGAYAGEALFETLKAGDRRLIGYAVDYGMRITNKFGSGTQDLRAVHFRNGALELKYSTVETFSYVIKNVDSTPKTLIVEQAAADSYTLLSPKPSERTAKAYRFEVKLAANGSQELKVEQEHSYLNTTALSTATPDSLFTLVGNRQIGERARQGLQQVSALKQQVIEADAATARARERMDGLNGEQTRLRENIDSLNRVKGQEEQVRTYSNQLAANEAALSKLGGALEASTQHKAALETRLRELISKLDF